jgi:MerR family copper efflux transcriptional regulator
VTSTTGYRISEVAARTGFSPTTLRYYEQIGLIGPTNRTAAGYRVYDDRSVARLTFIGRAKQLGLSLDEITELASLWDGDTCAPVQYRLTALLDAKRAELRGRIADLMALTGQLDAVAASIPDDPPAGPCDDDCGCATASPSAATIPIALTTKPSAPEAVPIACSLPASELRGQLAAWETLLAQAVGRERLDGGVALRFAAAPELASSIAELAVREHACCPFFSFTMRVDSDGLGLEVRAPRDAQDVVSALFGGAA